MTLDILIEALEMLRDRGDNPDYKRQVINSSLSELRYMKKHTTCDLSAWHGEVHVMHANDVIETYNMLMYDEFGRMARDHCGDVPFPVFHEMTRKKFNLSLGVDTARAVYEFLDDLWYDNEQSGSNNKDGTYNRNA